MPKILLHTLSLLVFKIVESHHCILKRRSFHESKNFAFSDNLFSRIGFFELFRGD